MNLPQKVVFVPGANILRLLVRADVTAKAETMRGCRKCDEVGCNLSPVLVPTTTIRSTALCTDFFIRGGWTCTSRDVVYVVWCKKCGLLGVGECEDPRERVRTYILAADHTAPGHSVVSSCCIHRHFIVTPHTKEDLGFIIVDGLSPSDNIREAVSHTIRARLESRWIHKLQAELNH
jgi:hypothetical protein